MEVSPTIVGIIGSFVLLVLFFLEMPVGLALLLVSFLGIWSISGLNQALYIIANIPYKTSVLYLWSLIPLFMFMGQIAYRSGLASDLFTGAFRWVGHVPGGLAVTTIGTSAGFGAVCGDPISAALTMTSVCLPEMRRYKYDDALSLGSICSGGILSFIIPPSIGFIVYGILANESISALFLAGVFPGLLIAFLYTVVIYIMCRINPVRGPAGPRASWTERLISLGKLWGVLILALIIFGGIYSGFITPTEAGALGAFAALVVGLVKGQLSWKNFSTAVLATVEAVGMVFLILFGAFTFAPFFNLTTIPQALAVMVSEWSPGLILLFFLVFYFLAGLVFDSPSLMIITIPLFLPIWITAGFDLIWFGVILIIIVILGCNTPPVGIIVYVVAGVVPDVPISKIFRGVIPFVPAVLVSIALIVAFPQIATFLPNLLRP